MYINVMCVCDHLCVCVCALEHVPDSVKYTVCVREGQKCVRRCPEESSLKKTFCRRFGLGLDKDCGMIGVREGLIPHPL